LPSLTDQLDAQDVIRSTAESPSGEEGDREVELDLAAELAPRVSSMLVSVKPPCSWDVMPGLPKPCVLPADEQLGTALQAFQMPTHLLQRCHAVQGCLTPPTPLPQLVLC
jgi:hypothetical protein